MLGSEKLAEAAESKHIERAMQTGCLARGHLQIRLQDMNVV